MSTVKDPHDPTMHLNARGVAIVLLFAFAILLPPVLALGVPGARGWLASSGPWIPIAAGLWILLLTTGERRGSQIVCRRCDYPIPESDPTPACPECGCSTHVSQLAVGVRVRRPASRVAALALLLIGLLAFAYRYGLPPGSAQIALELRLARLGALSDGGWADLRSRDVAPQDAELLAIDLLDGAVPTELPPGAKDWLIFAAQTGLLTVPTARRAVIEPLGLRFEKADPKDLNPVIVPPGTPPPLVLRAVAGGRRMSSVYVLNQSDVNVSAIPSYEFAPSSAKQPMWHRLGIPPGSSSASVRVLLLPARETLGYNPGPNQPIYIFDVIIPVESPLTPADPAAGTAPLR